MGLPNVVFMQQFKCVLNAVNCIPERRDAALSTQKLPRVASRGREVAKSLNLDKRRLGVNTGLTLVSECRTECRLTLVSECRGVGVASV